MPWILKKTKKQKLKKKWKEHCALFIIGCTIQLGYEHKQTVKRNGKPETLCTCLQRIKEMNIIACLCLMYPNIAALGLVSLCKVKFLEYAQPEDVVKHAKSVFKVRQAQWAKLTKNNDTS